MFACRFGRKDVVQLMLNHPRSQNIEINVKDNKGNTALMLAKSQGYTSVAKLLQNQLIKANNFVSNKNGAKRRRLNFEPIFSNMT